MVWAKLRPGEYVSIECRYYSSRLSEHAESMLVSICSHCGVENKLHGRLDVAFREDDSWIRKGAGAQNFFLLRPLDSTLLKRAPC
jgi:predicted transposase YbfD/YdcC